MTSAAERQRRRRERERNGDILVTVVVRRASREVLEDCRWIREWDADDRNAVQEAVQRLLDGIQPVTRNASG